MSARATTFWSFSETYCCLSLEPSCASKLNFTEELLSVAEYNRMGMLTKPKLRVKEAIDRAAAIAFSSGTAHEDRTGTAMFAERPVANGGTCCREGLTLPKLAGERTASARPRKAERGAHSNAPLHRPSLYPTNVTRARMGRQTAGDLFACPKPAKP